MRAGLQTLPQACFAAAGFPKILLQLHSPPPPAARCGALGFEFSQYEHMHQALATTMACLLMTTARCRQDFLQSHRCQGLPEMRFTQQTPLGVWTHEVSTEICMQSLPAVTAPATVCQCPATRHNPAFTPASKTVQTK